MIPCTITPLLSSIKIILIIVLSTSSLRGGDPAGTARSGPRVAGCRPSLRRATGAEIAIDAAGEVLDCILRHPERVGAGGGGGDTVCN